MTRDVPMWLYVSLWTVGACAFLVFILSLKMVERRIPWTVVRKDDLIEKRLSDEGLGRHCIEMSESLHAELADYKRDDPRTLNWGLGYPTDRNSPEYRARSLSENEYRAKFEARFSQKYAQRVSWLLHEIEERGLADSSDVWHASHAVALGDLGVSQLAALLGVVGHRLVERDGDAS